jgi:hypothetical protein
MDAREQSELRIWLAKRLKRSDVPDRLWAFLVNEKYVSEVLDDDYDYDREDLLRKARDIVRQSHEISAEFGGSPSPLSAGTEVTLAPLGYTQHPDEPSLGDHESNRDLAFVEYLAKLAEGNPAVQNFRRKLLRVETLTQEQAQDLVSSRALRYLSPSWFLMHHIPILGSQIRILDEERRPHPQIPVQELIVRVVFPFI